MPELSRKTVAFSKNAVNVFFHILTRCNLNCRHCYINPRQHGNITLDISTIHSWLNAFLPNPRPVNVIFLGGEPTLHPDLPQAVDYARQKGCASITIDTNGYLFHDFLSKVTPENVDYISFSLDGASAQTNDPIRGRGSFDTCIKGIRQAEKRGFAVSLIFTVSQTTLGGLRQMVPLLLDLQISRFFIQAIGLRGRLGNPKNSMEQVSHIDWLAVVPEVAAQAAAAGITTIYPKVFLEPGEMFDCAGNVADNYFIFPNGRVYRCPLCEDYPLHSMTIVDNRLCERPSITERELFNLEIPEGCVMNKLIQPGNIAYRPDGTPLHKIACCLLKEKIESYAHPGA